MSKVAIRTLDQASQVDDSASGEGAVDTRVYFDGKRHPIHLRVHRLKPGARLTATADAADLCLYVWDGEVTSEGGLLGERSSAVIQHGASLSVIASERGAALLAFNVNPAGAKPSTGHSAFLLPNERVPRSNKLGGNEGIGGALHADAHAPTANIWLHENDYAMADNETKLHSHSEDELIFVRRGSIKLGNRLYGPGTALAITADTLYQFWTGPEGLSFVNFRGASPTYTTADGSMVMDEAELWRGLLGRPEHIEVAAS